MKYLIFVFSLFLSLWAQAEAPQVDNECVKYGQNYVVKGSFLNTDPGGKTYNLDRLTGDLDNELNHFSNKPDTQKFNCLKQIFEKAKWDSSQYWTDRMYKEDCGDETGLPKVKPANCSSDTWEELKKSRANIRKNEVAFTKTLDSCLNKTSGSSACENSELQKLAASPMAKDMAAAKSEACCDKQNGAAYQVLKTFYTLEFKGDEQTLQKECTKRTMPAEGGVLGNSAAALGGCLKNLILGVIESIKKFGEMLSSLDLGVATELVRLLGSSEGRAKLASTLGEVLKSIATQVVAQVESFSCFNGYYSFQHGCKLTTSIATDFLIGGGIGKLLKSVILPVLKGVMKPFEAAAKMMKESKVAQEIAAKMKPISEAVGNKKQAFSASVQRASQAGLSQARALALATKLKMSKPFDKMLSASLKEKYVNRNVARAAKSSEPPPINGQFKVASASEKPSVSNSVASEAKPTSGASSSASSATSTASATASEGASLGASSIGSSAGKVLRTTVTTREARSLFSHLEKGLKKRGSSRITSKWIDQNIPKDLIPAKFRGKNLSVSEKIQAYRESLNQIAKIGTKAEKKRAGSLISQLDELSSASAAQSTRVSGSSISRGSVSKVDGRTSAVESPSKIIDEKPSVDLPEIKLSEIVPDASKLSPSSKSAWDELTQQISAFQKIPTDSPNASQLMQDAWKKFNGGGSAQAQRAHNSIDEMLKKGEITSDGANSLHRIISTAEQTAYNESVRPQFLGSSIVAPNTNPSTFERFVDTGKNLANNTKKLAKDGSNLVKSNKAGAVAYEASSTNDNGRQSEAFDDDTIKNAAVEVEKIESNLDSDQKIEQFFSHLESKTQVEDELDKMKARISTLLGAPGELSEERKTELKNLMDKLDKVAQKRISELEKPAKKSKK